MMAKVLYSRSRLLGRSAPWGEAQVIYMWCTHALWGKQAISTAVLSGRGKIGTRPPSLYPNQYEHKTTSARKSEGLGQAALSVELGLVTGKMTKEGLEML